MKKTEYIHRKAGKPAILTARFFKYTVVALLAVAVAAVAFVLRSSPAPTTSEIPVTGLSNPAPVPAEINAATEKNLDQVPASNDGLSQTGAALTQMSAISIGPDYAAVDIRLREQYQITEDYTFTNIDYASMTPSERQGLQITEDYP